MDLMKFSFKISFNWLEYEYCIAYDRSLETGEDGGKD